MYTLAYLIVKRLHYVSGRDICGVRDRRWQLAGGYWPLSSVWRLAKMPYQLQNSILTGFVFAALIVYRRVLKVE